MNLLSKKNSVNAFIALQVLSLYLINATYCFGHYVGVSYEPVSSTFKVVIAVMFLLCFFQNIGRFPRFVWVFAAVSAVVIALNFMFFPKIEQFSTTVVTFSTMCLTFYIVGSKVDDVEGLCKYVNIVSYFCSVLTAGFVVLNSIGLIRLLNEWGGAGYSMGFGNACALPAIFLIWRYFEKKKIVDIFFAIMLVLGIISFGSRGPLLGIGLATMFLWYQKSNNQNKGTTILFMCIGFGILFIFSDKILPLIGQLFHDLGIESRTIDLIFSDTEEVHMSGRDDIQNVIRKDMERDPYKVRGINAEYLLVGTYAHNLFLEIFYQLGYIWGFIVISVIFVSVIKTLRLKPTSNLTLLTQLLMIITISHSMFSSSLWSYPNFWFWLSLLNLSRLNSKKYVSQERI